MKNRIGECLPYSALNKKEKYEYVEENIRSLVNVLNSFKGVETIASCEGHMDDKNSYVAFLSTDENSLKEILEYIPHVVEFVINNETFKINTDISRSKECHNGAIMYCIRLSCTNLKWLHNLNNEIALAIIEKREVKLSNVLL